MGDLFGISDIYGSIIASDTAAHAQQAAKEATQQAVDLINAVGAPPDLAKQIVLQQYQKAGVLTPKMEQDINAHFEKIAGPSSQVQQAQMQALQGMSQAARGGMTAEDRVAQNNIQTQQARNNEAAKNSIIQNLAQRGQAGGGAELAMRLQAAQGNANNASQQSDQVAANAQMRALQALQGLGNLSSSQAAQQFSQNQANTGIANEQNRFNVANQIASQSRNVAAQNQAQNLNLSNAQNLANMNVGNANTEAQRQVNAQQQMYADKMAHAQSAANAKIGQGSQIAAFGMDQAKAQGQMIGGAGTLGQGIYNYATASNTPKNQNVFGENAAGNSAGSDYSAAGQEMIAWQGGKVPTRHEMGYYTGGEVYPQSGLNSEAEYADGGEVSNNDLAMRQMLMHQQNINANNIAQQQALANLQSLGAGNNQQALMNQQQSGRPSSGSDLSQFTQQTFPENYNQGGRVNYTHGGHVNGPVVVPGSSPQNDIIPARLSSGEYVVPKEDAPSMELIHQILKGMKAKKK